MHAVVKSLPSSTISKFALYDIVCFLFKFSFYLYVNTFQNIVNIYIYKCTYVCAAVSHRGTSLKSIWQHTDICVLHT